MPEGRLWAPLPPVPDASPPPPRPPDPLGDPCVSLGAPEAPVFPSGDAANDPRRLPAGTCIGPFTSAGATLNAISRPPPEFPAPATVGGGGTTFPAPATLEPVVAIRRDPAPESSGAGATTSPRPALPRACPGKVRWAATGNCGAGATTELGPTFRSPAVRSPAICTVGGGATTFAVKPCADRDLAFACNSGGGATIPEFKFGSSRLDAWLTSADGGTTVTGTLGKLSDVRAVAAIGIGMLLFPHATIFGRGTSWSSFTFGGVMIVCR